MRKPTVFIVEDDLQTRKQISFMVNSLGYDVVGTAGTGKSAISKIRHIKPDIIIMDYQLRGDWDGIETAQHVESLNWKTATIFITAHAANISQKDLQNISLDGFLSKPIIPEVLRHAIDIAAKRIASDLKIEHLTDLLQMVNQESTLLSRRYDDEDPLSFLGNALIKIRGYISVWTIITDENRKPIHYTFSSDNKSPNKDLQRIIAKKKLPDTLYKQLDAKNNIVIVDDNPIGEKEDGILSKYIIIQLSTKQQLTGLMGIRIPYSMAITNEEIKILKGMGLDIGLFLYNRYLEDRTEKTNSLYKTMFDSNPVVKLILDPRDGSILEANPAACKFYDYDYDVLTSMNISQIAILPKSATGAATSDEQDLLVQHRTASGQVKQVEVYTSKVFLRGKPVIDMIIHDITDCVETEEQLEEAESHFSQVFLNLPDYCYMVSKDGYMLNANKAAVKTLGYKGSEIIGKHILEIYTEDSKEKAKQAFNKMDNNGQLRNIELSIKTKTGKERQVLLNVDVVKNKDGEFQYALSIQRDITDRKNAERALLKSHEQFKAVMDSLDAFVYVCDMDTYELLYVNKAGKDAFGSDIKGKVCWQTMQANQQGPCSFCTNEKLLTKDGRPNKPYKWEFQNTVTKQWLLIIDRAIKWHDGRIVRLEIATDITDRKQVERTLIESKKQLDAITEASFEAIFISEKGICIGQNKQGKKMFGYSEEEIVGKPSTDWIIPEDRDLVKHHMLAGHEEPYEVQALRKDGTTFPALMQGRMMEYQGRTVRFTALQDISYIKKKEKELTQLSERFALATKSAKTGVWDWHINDNISVWDETICEMYGIAKDTRRVSYDTWKSFVHPNDLERVLAETESALKGEKDFDTLYRIIRADKSVRYLRATAVVKRDESGNPVRMIGANWDVTARLEAEIALEESEE
ncbi:MAG: PAS domain S-box protein, partial [Simkaniaceae bacterium]|nr:PAS domain S-box protein [Simkaniaceae bacterium]